jgi:hypothetical protein
MAQTEVKVRVRPNRIAVLIPESATFDDLSLAVRFLSRIWGGRHCPILPVKAASDDPRALHWLAQFRPDFVYTLGLDLDVWSEIAKKACQPRACKPLVQMSAESMHIPQRFRVTTVLPAIQMYRDAPNVPAKARVQLVRARQTCALAPFVSVVFGDSAPDWGDDRVEYPGEDSAIWITDEHGYSDIVRIAAEQLSATHISFLDLANEGLRTLYESMPIPPTIVVVSRADDLALAWNLRIGAKPDDPRWVIPVPKKSLSDESVFRALREWLLTFQGYERSTTFCEIVSLSVPSAELSEFAAQLRQCVVAHSIMYVDVISPCITLPFISCYDTPLTLRAEIDGPVLTIAAARPSLSNHLQPGDSWVVEMYQDARSNRSPAEMCLPARPCVQELLNLPAAPRLPIATSVPQFAFKKGSITAHCTLAEEFIHFCAPSAEELLEEILIESGISPTDDEKRRAYTPAFELLGGLGKTAHYFKGRLRHVLRILHSKGSARLSAIQSDAKLGNGKLPDELGEPHQLKALLKRLSPTAERITLKRSREYRQQYYPDDTKLKSLLEHWRKNGFLLEANQAFSLEPQLDKAIGEGLIPVALTGNFLRNLPGQGFLWVPGVKYRRGTILGDIDVMALCDGALVLAECKDMERVPKSSPDWEDSVWPKFDELMTAAIQCRANMVVLASLADAYPDDWEIRANVKVGESMTVLFLTREDLDSGHRHIPIIAGMQRTRPLFMHDLLHYPEEERAIRQPPGERLITQGTFSASYGS